MSFFGSLAFYVLTFIVLQYLGLRLLIGLIFKPKNLKRAYGAQWALVTGASSGVLGLPPPLSASRALSISRTARTRMLAAAP